MAEIMQPRSATGGGSPNANLPGDTVEGSSDLACVQAGTCPRREEGRCRSVRKALNALYGVMGQDVFGCRM